jgi:hypothetical protein
VDFGDEGVHAEGRRSDNDGIGLGDLHGDFDDVVSSTACNLLLVSDKFVKRNMASRRNVEFGRRKTASPATIQSSENPVYEAMALLRAFWLGSE